jgi:aldose 1-epimerase
MKLAQRFGATVALGLALLATNACRADSITMKLFGVTNAGESVVAYTLATTGGATATVITYGATLIRLKVPDKNGNLGDVVLGFDNLQQYENESPYFGATVGRICNRIAKGMFSIDNAHYCLAVNNGPNHLHGGFRGYDKRIWNSDAAMTTDGPSVRFTLVDPDGTEGYPGNVHVTVIYSLEKLPTGTGLKIQFFAKSDQATPINLTHHSYFNLKDGGKSDVLSHVMKIYGDHYLPVDETLIPTGEIAPVKGTIFDFTFPKAIGRDLKTFPAEPNNYDNNICIANPDGRFMKAAEVFDPDSGRFLECWTTEPGVQLYTAQAFDGSLKGHDGTPYPSHAGFTLETQGYPDAVNHPNFPNTVLDPGETYRQITEYRFSTPGKTPW